MNSLHGFGFMAGMMLLLSLSGCSGSDSGYKTASELKKEKPPAVTVEKSGHDHDGHGHDEHHHDAPHGGSTVMLGDHVGHVEIVLDQPSGKITVYILDGLAEKPVAPDQKELLATVTIEHPAGEKKEGEKKEGEELAEGAPFELKLAGEVTGDEPIAVFMGQADQLKGAGHFDVKIAELTIKGETFKATMIHCGAGDHDHDHAHEHEADKK